MVLFSFSLFCFIFISDLVESFDIQTLYEESVPVSFYKKKRKDEKISMSICLLANNSTLSSSVLSVGCCFFFWGFRRCSFVFDPKQPVLLVVDFFGVFLICIFQFDWFPIRHSFLVDFFPKKNIKKRVFFGLFFP